MPCETPPTRNTIHILRGDYARAFEEFAALQAPAESRITAQILICVRQQLAWSYFELGAYDAAQDQCRRALDYPDEGQPARHVPTLTLLTLIHVARGHWTEAAHAAARGGELFDRARKFYPEWWEALPFPLAQGELALAQGDRAQAEECVAYLETEFSRLRLRHLWSSGLFLRARVALAEAEKAAAHQDLQAAVAVSDEIGSHRELQGICWMLGQLESAQGNRAAANYWHDQACAEITVALESIAAPQWRALFLARADVQSILSVRQLTS